MDTKKCSIYFAQKFPGLLDWPAWSHLEWICYFMAYSSTAINPFVYACFSENYKYGKRKFHLTIKFDERVKYDFF